MGLIAREIERQGIPTVSLTSAWSITRSVNPPRAVFTDFPLGHTAGPPHDGDMQRAILRDALAELAVSPGPGTIRTLPYLWAPTDDWKDRAMRANPDADGRPTTRDDRVERHAEPQYQDEADRLAAGAAAGCPGCIWLGEVPADVRSAS